MKSITSASSIATWACTVTSALSGSASLSRIPPVSIITNSRAVPVRLGVNAVARDAGLVVDNGDPAYPRFD